MPRAAQSNPAREKYRADLYNAIVTEIRRPHDDLIIMRVLPDAPVAGIQPGNYTTLGLGNWEPRVAGCQAEDAADNVQPKLIKRAYSLSCPLLDSNGRLVGVNADNGILEFYIALVRHADRPPALTPRLFALKANDRLFCGDRPHGHYSVEGISSTTNIVLASTGTGEAPHNTMLVKLLQDGHQGQIVAINCVRFKRDLGYLEAHRQLEKQASNYQYIPLTTREPENIDNSHPDYVGKRYVQQYFESGEFTAETGLALDPANTHVFLCGNPDMIGLPGRDHPATATTAVLLQKGFELDRPAKVGASRLQRRSGHAQLGKIHFEKYW